LTRRTLIRLSAGTAAAVALPAVLSACSGIGLPGAGSSTPVPASSKVQYPSYAAFGSAPKPDLAATDLVPAAYYRFPENLVQAVTTPPGKGGDITAFTSTVGPPPPPVEQSATWQAVNKAMNVNLKLIIAGNQADQLARLSTMVAGGDIPDAFSTGPTLTLARFPDFLAAQCADLTPFLAGDAVKDFPNLANIPTFVWKGPGTVYNGRIYGLPLPRSLYTSHLMAHWELLNQAGITEMPKNADDFKKMLQTVNRPADNVYAIVPGSTLNGLGAGERGIFPQIFGAPNGWRLESSGKLTKDWETEEFKAGLGFARDVWAAGLYHPNSLTYNNVSSDSDFTAGSFALYVGAWNGFSTVFWPGALRLNPNAKLGAIDPFSADGKAKPSYYWASGNFGNTHIKKASDDRVRELLGMLNFLASPFGTVENTLLAFGVKDVDYTLDSSGNPVAIPGGFASGQVPWRFLADKPSVEYNAVRSKDFADVTHTAEMAMAAVGITDPTYPLYSATKNAAGVPAAQTVVDGITSIVTGRDPLSNFDQLIADWRSKVGDTVRAEYQDALQVAK
jgi:putative aldouronate transport system substrate-binding protein